MFTSPEGYGSLREYTSTFRYYDNFDVKVPYPYNNGSDPEALVD